MLPWPQRLYFWGVNGIFVEVVFTGLWEFVVSGNINLMGISSIWSFFVYGLGTFLAESFYNLFISFKIPLLVRCLFYTLLIYLWEFACGLLLNQFGVKSWDYSQFTYNVMGLITMEYAPLWFFAGLYFEGVMSAMKSVESTPRWKNKIE